MSRSLPRWWKALVLTLLATMLAACGGTGSPATSQSAASAADASSSGHWPVTVKDSTGASLTISAEPQRIVLLNSNAADLVRMFGKQDKVVGVADGITSSRPYLTWGKQVTVLDAKDAQVAPEAVAGLRPDLVVSYAFSPDAAFLDQLRRANIPVLRLNLFLPATQDQDIAEFGKALGAESTASHYLSWKAEQLKPLDAVKGKATFSGLALSGGALNGGQYFAFPTDVGEGGGFAAAGVRNVVDDVKWNNGSGGTATQVNGEYILKRNPDVITLNHSSKEWGGYDASADAGKALYAKALADKVISQTTAGRRKHILVLHTQVMGADKRFVGQLAVAKMLYPQDFVSVHPQAVLDEYFTKWLKVTPGGHWIYPEMP